MKQKKALRRTLQRGESGVGQMLLAPCTCLVFAAIIIATVAMITYSEDTLASEEFIEGSALAIESDTLLEDNGGDGKGIKEVISIGGANSGSDSQTVRASGTNSKSKSKSKGAIRSKAVQKIGSRTIV
jgi:hypothetical protein